MFQHETADLYAEALKDPSDLLEAAECIKVRIRDIPSGVKDILKYMATKEAIDPYEKESPAVYSFVDAFVKLLKEIGYVDTIASALDYRKTFDTLFIDPNRPLKYSLLADKVVARMKKERKIERFPLEEFLRELKSKGILFETQRLIGLTSDAREAKRILDDIRNPNYVYMSMIADYPHGKLFDETNKPKSFEEFKSLYLDLVLLAINEKRIDVPSVRRTPAY
jgi:uncharacterized protein YdhG (YjbR/CyaY superfamily)